VQANHGVQFTSWVFTNKIRDSGLIPSFGTIGDCYDAMMESFWSSMQIELLNRKEMVNPARPRERDICSSRDLV